MTMHTKPVKSSQIASVGYDATTKLLRVNFTSGSSYHYDDVSLAEFDALMRADSIGAHFHKHIRTAKKYRKIEP